MDGSPSEVRCRPLLWVGGPPGQTLVRLKEKLERDGLRVDDAQEVFQRIPRRAELVLVNIDMISHGSFDAVRAAAKQRNVPCIAAHNDYSRTRAALERAGLLPPCLSTTREAHGATMSDQTDSSSFKASLATCETSAEELRAFIAALPKSLLEYARQEVARRLREDDVQLAAAAVLGLDADGLLDLLNALPAAKRDEFKSALQ